MYDEIELHAYQTKAGAIIPMITASISLFFSSCLISVILRTRKKLSSTQNRILFNMSICDAIGSASLAFSTLPLPKENLNCTFWKTLGNQTTCEIQGFFFIFGYVACPTYTISLCFYYLCVIKYGMKSDVMTRRVEPLLHFIPIFSGLLLAIIPFFTMSYNPLPTWVTCSPDMTKSIACVYAWKDKPEYEEICPEDGKNIDYYFSWAVYISTIFFFVVITTVMSTIVRFVSKTEKRTVGYSSSVMTSIVVRWSARRSLKFETKRKSNETSDDAVKDMNKGRGRKTPKEKLTLWQGLKHCLGIKPSTYNKHKKKNKTNTMAVQAFAYVSGYFITQLFPFINYTINLNRALRENQSSPPPIILEYLHLLFFPLQGFFNFMIFIHPRAQKVRTDSKNEYSLLCCIYLASIYPTRSFKKSNSRKNRRKIAKNYEDTCTTQMARNDGIERFNGSPLMSDDKNIFTERFDTIDLRRKSGDLEGLFTPTVQNNSTEKNDISYRSGSSCKSDISADGELGTEKIVSSDE